MAKRSPRRPGSIDTHLGKRLRVARQRQHVSQMDLAEMLGITFQQVQKYEKGVNRISAARLFNIAHLLQVPIGFFFSGVKISPELKRRPRSRE